MLFPKQILQRKPIVLVQLKAGNASEKFLNEFHQIIYSLYREKEITKKIYNNIMNSTKSEDGMGAIIINSRNSKTSDSHRLLLNLTDKIDLKRSDKYNALSSPSIYYT